MTNTGLLVISDVRDKVGTAVYVIRSSHGQEDVHEAIVVDLLEAKKMAHVISMYTNSVISVVEQETHHISSSFLRGNELLVLPSADGHDWSPSISEDAAQLLGRRFWSHLAFDSRKIGKLLAKQHQSASDLMEVERVQSQLEDVLCTLQIELDDTVYAALYHKWIESIKFQHRSIAIPPQLRYSEPQIRRKVRQGHIQTGEIAYLRGWNTGALRAD